MKKKLFAAIMIFFYITICLYGQSENNNENPFSNLSNSTPPITVTIGGDFLVTGSFPSYSGERLDQFITRIYNQAFATLKLPSVDEKIFVHMLSEAQNYPLRGIVLKSKEGNQKQIDLLKFRLTGDFSYNPYLQNDDVVVFPSYDSDYGIVEINGAVNKSTIFQFVEGDKLSDAIFFARGLNKAYENVTQALISRLSYDGTNEELIEVDLNNDIALKPGDRIKILADQTKRRNYKILVLGEVRNPGEIYITENNTTIKDAIDKVGGFTEKASLKDAELVRNFSKQQILLNQALRLKAKEDPSLLNIPEDEVDVESMKEILRMNRAADLLEDDTLFFSVSNQLRILEGETRIDFREIDSANSVASQYIVKDGDIIIVPQKFETVYVFGQVGIPGYYNFMKDRDFSYYINQAGGLTATAKDEDEIYLIKGKGREWINIDAENYKIEPGDYIYVLKEIPRDVWYYVSRIGTVAGIVGSIATLVLLFK